MDATSTRDGPDALPLPLSKPPTQNNMGLGSKVGAGGIHTPPEAGSPTMECVDPVSGARSSKKKPRSRSFSGNSAPAYDLRSTPPVPHRPAKDLEVKTSRPSKTLPKKESRPAIPFAERLLSRGTSLLPPALPPFQSGGRRPSSVSSHESIGKAATVPSATVRPPLSPKHPGRKAHSSRSSSGSPQPPNSSSWAYQKLNPITFKSPSSYIEYSPYIGPAAVAPHSSASSSSTPLLNGLDFGFHAVTAEEPIILPSRRTSTCLIVPKDKPTMPISKSRDPQKKERRGSFLGGWKLNMKATSRPETDRDDVTSTPSDVSPIGVGSGGGWVYRRRGSFSSPHPPSTDKHKAYAQEYKDFRSSKGSGSSKGSSGDSSTGPGSSAATTFTARAEAERAIIMAPPAPIKRSGTRKSLKEKIKSVEARFQKHPAVAVAVPEIMVPIVKVITPDIVLPIAGMVEEKDLEKLEVAVRHMSLLEEQLKNGQPPSPPDSIDDEADSESEETEKAQPAQPGLRKAEEQQQVEAAKVPKPRTAIQPTKIPVANKGKQHTLKPLELKPKKDPGKSTPSLLPVSVTKSSTTIATKPSSHRLSLQQPAPPPGTNHKKTKSLSPLRNELGTTPTPPPDIKGKGKETEKDPDTFTVSSHHSANSMYPPPSEYLGKPRSTTTIAPMAGISRPPTPPKPIAKLFVICCQCKVCVYPVEREDNG